MPFGRFFQKQNSPRDFEVRQPLTCMVSQFFLVGHQPVAQRNESEYLFTMSPNRIGHSNHGNLEHRRMVVKRLLHLLRRYVEAVANDDLFLATFEPQVSVGVTAGEIASMEQAVP
jgi:hypothetical protein